jgi:hypothetical protein
VNHLDAGVEGQERAARIAANENTRDSREVASERRDQIALMLYNDLI